MKTNPNNPICDYCKNMSVGELFLYPGEYIYYCKDHKKDAIDELSEIDDREQLESQNIKNSATFLEVNNILASGVSGCIIMALIVKYYYAVPGSLNWKLIIPNLMYVFAVLVGNAISLRRKNR